MSTTATISPYVPEERNSITGDIASGIALAAVATGKFLIDSLKHDDRQKEILSRYREDQWKIDAQNKPLKTELNPLSSMSAALKPVSRTMKFNSYETFLKPAESLGFKLSPIAMPDKPLETQSRLILTGLEGERLVVTKTKAGKVNIKSNAGIKAIDNVNAKRSRDIVEEYQKNNYSELKREETANGEITYVSLESRNNPDGQAIITTTIKNNGEVTVDVSNIKGKRCETIIQDLARAVGGECIKTSRKSQYFQQVEERGKVRV